MCNRSIKSKITLFNGADEKDDSLPKSAVYLRQISRELTAAAGLQLVRFQK